MLETHQILNLLDLIPNDVYREKANGANHEVNKLQEIKDWASLASMLMQLHVPYSKSVEQLFKLKSNDMSISSQNGLAFESVPTMEVLPLKDHRADYPNVSIEDPFDKEDWEHTKQFLNLQFCQVVGDGLLMSSPKHIDKAVQELTCNACLLKISQIGTVTEGIEAVRMAEDAHWGVVVAHRSSETDDTFIADLFVGLGTNQIKAGAPCQGSV